jgi:hypothetical protein
MFGQLPVRSPFSERDLANALPSSQIEGSVSFLQTTFVIFPNALKDPHLYSEIAGAVASRHNAFDSDFIR